MNEWMIEESIWNEQKWCCILISNEEWRRDERGICDEYMRNEKVWVGFSKKKKSQKQTTKQNKQHQTTPKTKTKQTKQKQNKTTPNKNKSKTNNTNQHQTKQHQTKQKQKQNQHQHQNKTKTKTKTKQKMSKKPVTATPSTFQFTSPAFDVEQARTFWAALRQAIKEIQNGNASQLRYEELYRFVVLCFVLVQSIWSHLLFFHLHRNAYTLVLHKYGDMLYQGVTECITDKLKEASEVVASATNERLLEVLVEEWQHHKLIMTMIRDTLMYMVIPTQFPIIPIPIISIPNSTTTITIYCIIDIFFTCWLHDANCVYFV